MANVNLTIMVGNLTRDVELRATQSGAEVAKFALAVNRRTKDGETTCFIDCTAFGKTAQTLHQYVRKGSPIFVQGRLDWSQWVAKDGGKRSKHELIVERFEFLSQRDEGEGTRTAYSSRSAPPPIADDGDIPF